MNKTYVDVLAADGTLNGDAFIYNGISRRWTKIFAHSAASVTLTSDTMTLNDGSTLLESVTLAIPAGETYEGYFKIITRNSGVISCTRAEGI